MEGVKECIIRLTMLSALVLICSATLASAIFGPISTDAPAPAGGSIANDVPPLASFYAGHSPPYPTDDWWVGYGAGSGNAYVSMGPPLPNGSADIYTASPPALSPMNRILLVHRFNLGCPRIVNSMALPSSNQHKPTGLLGLPSTLGTWRIITLFLG